MSETGREMIRYTADGREAYQGDKVTVNDTGEHAYLRVLGQRGYVTVLVMGADRIPVYPARVYHITDISFGHKD